MRVLFIYTDIGISVGYSCGIGVLSACLKQHGHESRLIHVSEELDYPLDLERTLKDVRDYDPGLIGFSAVTNQWCFVKQIANHLRRFLDTPIIVGGHHADAIPHEVILEPAIDYVCKGEGERSLVELADRLEAGQSVYDIPNIVSKKPARSASGKAQPSPDAEAECEIIDNKVGYWVQSLDDLPFEDREIFDYDRIVRTRYGWAEVIGSRGCPYSCSYCFNTRFLERYRSDLQGIGEPMTRKQFVRHRSPQALVAMLKDTKDRYPDIKYFTFVDDAFAINVRWLAELAPLYAREIGLPMACTSQPLVFNEKIARILKRMQCKVVKMGVEAGSERIRKELLNRNISDEVLFRAFKLARDHDLKPQAFNMIGLPTETRQDMMKTIRLNAELRPYIVWVSIFQPYPGTEIHDFCISNGLIDSTRWDDVHSYRAQSVLNETSFTALDLEETRVLFRAYLNVFLDNECSQDYRKLIEDMKASSEDEWFSGRVENRFNELDVELDMKWRRRKVDH